MTASLTTPRIAPTVAGGEDLRWVSGALGCADYVDAIGLVHGCATTDAGQACAYVLLRDPEGLIVGHVNNVQATPEAARAWVEAEVRRSLSDPLVGGEGA